MRDPNNPGLYLVIEGGVGAGKSTFCRYAKEALAPRFPKVEFLEEPADPASNPILFRFLEDMPRWAFSLQVYFLNYRFFLHRQAQVLRVSGGAALMDRCVWLDTAFGRINLLRGNMTEDEWRVYEQMRVNILDYLNYPDLVIWLDIPPKQQMDRILRRARPGESTGYTLEYLEDLYKQYEERLASLGKHTTVHRVAWSDFNDETIKSQVPYVLDSALRQLRGGWADRQGW